VNLKQLKRQEEKLDKRIAQYLAELDVADKAEPSEVVDRSAINHLRGFGLKFNSRTTRAVRR
jgi:hypothetical protein